MSTNPDHLLIASLLSNPLLNQEQIAQIAGVSSKTVYRVNKELKKASEGNQVEIEAFKMLLREQMPAESRVRVLKELMDTESNPFVRLNTVKYTNDVLRINPQTQPDQQDTDVTKPMFSLPNATHVTVNIRTGNDTDELDECIDVTPNPVNTIES